MNNEAINELHENLDLWNKLCKSIKHMSDKCGESIVYMETDLHRHKRPSLLCFQSKSDEDKFYENLDEDTNSSVEMLYKFSKAQIGRAIEMGLDIRKTRFGLNNGEMYCLVSSYFKEVFNSILNSVSKDSIRKMN